MKGNIVIISNRIVMPTKLKAKAMETLRRGNAGVNTMRERAKEAMCWPAMTGDITRTREGCKTCCVTAPSQAATPLTPLPVSDYPFQMVLSDYFDWLGVSQQKNCTTKELVSTLRNYIGTFGVMDELTTNGDPVILGHKVTEFLHGFGIKHRVSSAYHPHSNQREEAVKATGLTSSEVIYGRKIKDLLSHAKGKLVVRAEWHQLMKHQELVLAKKHLKTGQGLSEHCWTLRPLELGRSVDVQILQGNEPKRWTLTGVIVERGDFEKYTIKLYSSGHLMT